MLLVDVLILLLAVIGKGCSRSVCGGGGVLLSHYRYVFHWKNRPHFHFLFYFLFKLWASCNHLGQKSRGFMTKTPLNASAIVVKAAPSAVDVFTIGAKFEATVAVVEVRRSGCEGSSHSANA